MQQTIKVELEVEYEHDTVMETHYVEIEYNQKRCCKGIECDCGGNPVIDSFEWEYPESMSIEAREALDERMYDLDIN